MSVTGGVAVAYRKVNGGEGGEAATRRQLPGGERTVVGHGGSGELWSETAARGRNSRWLRRTAVARVFHACAEANLREARAASSGLRLRRGWCLRLRLDERNTMMALDVRDDQWLGSYGRFTKRKRN